jgi:hypothetical protein
MKNMAILNMTVNGVSGVLMVQFRSNAMPIRMAVEKTGDCGPNDISSGKATLHGASGSLPLNDRIAIPTGTPG